MVKLIRCLLLIKSFMTKNEDLMFPSTVRGCGVNFLGKAVGMEDIVGVSCKVSLSSLLLCWLFLQAPHDGKRAAEAPATTSSWIQ